MNVSSRINIDKVVKLFTTMRNKLREENEVDKYNNNLSFEKLFFIWDLALSKAFATCSDYVYIMDTDEGMTVVSKSYCDEPPKGPVTMSNIPDNSVTLGISIEHCMLEIFIGQTSAMRITLLGPVAYDAAFNDGQFTRANKQYAKLLNAWSDVIHEHDKIAMRLDYIDDDEDDFEDEEDKE